jgi:tetratricopeptide (TPR) repeat protein
MVFGVLVTGRGYTPLNYALESKNLKLINLLKEYGAREGETAVSYDAAVDAFEHYQKGDAYYKNNDFPAAQSEFLKSIEINPRHFESYQYLTVLLSYEKKWDEMIAYFDRFLELEPDHAMAYFKRAWVYHQKRDLETMNADLTKACDLGNIEACQRLGRPKP